MASDNRTAIIVGGLLGLIVAGTLATPAVFPQAFAAEPQSHILDTANDIFPPPFDPSKLRKYDLVFDDSVSTKPDRTETVTKIGYGDRQVVSIIHTPSGTYSSDGLLSPNVRYPGIKVTRKHGWSRSFWAFGSSSSRYGSSSWSSFSSGSFTYFTYRFKRS